MNLEPSAEKQNIRVLMIGPDRSVHGGISGVVNNLYEAGLDKEISLTYIGTMKDGSKLKKLFVAVISYMRFCLSLSKNDIVHVHVASDNSYRRKSFFIKRAKKCGKKILIHQHGGEWEEYYSNLSQSAKEKVRSTFELADHFMTVSESHKRFFENRVGLKNVEVYPNTVSVPDYKDRAFNSHRLLFMGRICREKGIEELIDAVTSLRGKFKDLELVLAGIWEDRDLKMKAGSHGEFIKYAGWVTGEDKKNLMDNTDIFVLPSYFEGLPVTVLETMAAGMCVVASDVGGIPMIIKDNETGMLIRAKDKDSLRDALERLLSDKGMMHRLSRSGYEFVKDNFNIKDTVSGLVRIYKGMLNE